MTGKPVIPFEDFLKLDLRVATISACEHHPDADRLLILQLDDGTEDGRQICAGIRAWYEPGDLVGRQVVICANLEPRTIRGAVSAGMVLAATDGTGEGGEQVVLLGIDAPVAPGAGIS